MGVAFILYPDVFCYGQLTVDVVLEIIDRLIEKVEVVERLALI
jgi:(2Fe-2S) ferredoxin